MLFYFSYFRNLHELHITCHIYHLPVVLLSLIFFLHYNFRSFRSTYLLIVIQRVFYLFPWIHHQASFTECFHVNHLFMAKEAKAPMTLVWLKALQPLCILENILSRKQRSFNGKVLCPVKNKQPHYPVISVSLSTVCFHISFFPILTLQLARTLLMLCLTKLSFTVKLFHRMNLLFHHLQFNFYYCCYFRLLFVLAKDHRRDWGHLLSGTDMEKIWSDADRFLLS